MAECGEFHVSLGTQAVFLVFLDLFRERNVTFLTTQVNDFSNKNSFRLYREKVETSEAYIAAINK